MHLTDNVVTNLGVTTLKTPPNIIKSNSSFLICNQSWSPDLRLQNCFYYRMMYFGVNAK